jgi:protein-S-isoprenylcysteine O-methyltransferase Ste14
MDPNNRRLPSSLFFRLATAFLFCAATVLLFGVPLFLSAGSLLFARAWLFLGLLVVSWFLIFSYLAVRDPDLFEKRTTARAEDPSQRLLETLLVTTCLGTLIVAGLDYRNRWSAVPLGVSIFFAFVVMGGNFMLFLVMKQNTFGSRAIEIQTNQQVIDTGLYSVVRHPMYLAFAIIFCFAPLVLGSFYALPAAWVIPVWIALRIRNEEQLLQKGLEGYAAYTRKVKYRLIPFLW